MSCCIGLRLYADGGVRFRVWNGVLEWGVAREEIVPEDEVVDVNESGVLGLERSRDFR